MNGLKQEAREMFERAKESIQPTVEDIKEKAAPTLERAEQKADEAIRAVKQGAKKLGDLLQPQASAPGLNIQNEFFDELESQAKDAKAAALEKAAEMQCRLEEMMGGKKES